MKQAVHCNSVTNSWFLYCNECWETVEDISILMYFFLQCKIPVTVIVRESLIIGAYLSFFVMWEISVYRRYAREKKRRWNSYYVSTGFQCTEP